MDVVTDLAITGKPAQFGRGVMQDVSDRLLGQFVACLAQQLTPAEPVADPTSATEPEPEAETVSAASAPDVAQGSASDGPAAAPQPSRPAPQPVAPPNDALDLGATVLPVLLKSYWKPAAATAAAAVVVIVWLISR